MRHYVAPYMEAEIKTLKDAALGGNTNTKAKCNIAKELFFVVAKICFLKWKALELCIYFSTTMSC